jgi:hypothetical protein
MASDPSVNSILSVKRAASPTKRDQRSRVGAESWCGSPETHWRILQIGTDAGLGDSFSHAAMAAGVAIMVSNSIGVKRPSAA